MRSLILFMAFFTQLSHGMELVEEIKAWRHFRHVEENVLLCMAQTKAENGSLLTVSTRPFEGVLNETSVTVNETFALKSAQIKISKETFEMTIQTNVAFLFNPEQNEAVAAAIRSGDQVRFVALLKDGSELSEVFSLAGSSKALNAAQACEP